MPTTPTASDAQPSPNDTYTSPLASRNASPEMLRLWSPRHKFNTWRRIWLAVAEAQHEVTKDWPETKGDSPLVTAKQVEALRAVVERGITDAELARATEIERDLRHDVMAHVHCLGESCPEAKAIIHLGCTSQDVVCNGDLLTIEAARVIIETKLTKAISSLGEAAKRFRAIPTLGFTHYQPAQPTTIGRRCASWAQDLCLVSELSPSPWLKRLRGFRGATGTQASFLNLFGGDPGSVDVFEAEAVSRLLYEEGWHRSVAEYRRKNIDRLKRVADAARADGRDVRAQEIEEQISHYEEETHGDVLVRRLRNYIENRTLGLTGQTYARVIDSIVLGNLASIAAVLHKTATDIRLLSNRKEIDEPFGSKQIGSSAMPYKRNPMRCERICGLTRFVMNLVGNAYDTAATQWLERTLDDSSNRRLSLPESFLALDGALDLMHNVASGLIVHEKMVEKNLMLELPFLATENILMEAVKAGGDRQDLHERIRVHAQEAGHRVKHLGLDNNLIDLLKADPAFAAVHDRLTGDDLLDPMKYVGRSVEQTERFVAEVVEPLRERYKDELAGAADTEPRV